MSRRLLLATMVVLLQVGVMLRPAASPQAPQAPVKRPPEELRRLSIAAEVPGLAEPFTGITTNGKIETGLFGIRSTGVSTKPVRDAADAFLARLTKAQRDRTTLPWTTPSGGSG